MAKKQSKSQLPPAGSAFSFPTGDGRLAVCRVLQDAESPAAKAQGGKLTLAATSAWIGKKLPPLDAPELREILRLTHHSWKNEKQIVWAIGKPPADFKLIGIIPPTAAERKLECNSFGYWDRGQPLWQWRWDHDRAAVLKEDAAKNEADERTRRNEAATRRAYLKKVTLKDLAKHEFFPGWKRLPGKRLTKLSREIMAGTVRKLSELGAKAKKSERLALLQECIAIFNELDAREGHFIETEEREDICFEFEAICHACGLGSQFEEVLEERDW